MKHKFINKKAGAEARVIAMYLDSDGVMQVDGYDTVEDLMDDYAAYEKYEPPKEPLIKDEDEKIRKAVRAWAEVNKTKYVWVSVTSDGISITQDERHKYPTEYKQSITFECEVEFKSGYYTVDELCGEEKE